MTVDSAGYPARLEIDYPSELDRLTTFFRLIWAIPILAVYSIITATTRDTVKLVDEAGRTVETVHFFSRIFLTRTLPQASDKPGFARPRVRRARNARPDSVFLCSS